MRVGETGTVWSYSGNQERLEGRSSGYRERLRPFADSEALPLCMRQEAVWMA
jgi:hypothetical protein